MTFIRVPELCFLNLAYETAAAQLVILHGRRRVGKTALLREFSKSKPALYFVFVAGS